MYVCIYDSLIEALDKYYKGQWSQMKSDPQFSDRVGYHYKHTISIT